MIKYQTEFETYIKANGKGPAEKVAESVKTYVANLNSVSRHLGISINAKVLGTDSDIDDLSGRLSQLGKISPKNIKFYRSAMQQYVNMVNGI